MVKQETATVSVGDYVRWRGHWRSYEGTVKEVGNAGLDLGVELPNGDYKVAVATEVTIVRQAEEVTTKK